MFFGCICLETIKAASKSIYWIIPIEYLSVRDFNFIRN